MATGSSRGAKARRWPESFGVPFFETSAKSGDGVDAAFMGVAERAVRRLKQDAGGERGGAPRRGARRQGVGGMLLVARKYGRDARQMLAYARGGIAIRVDRHSIPRAFPTTFVIRVRARGHRVGATRVQTPHVTLLGPIHSRAFHVPHAACAPPGCAATATAGPDVSVGASGHQRPPRLRIFFASSGSASAIAASHDESPGEARLVSRSVSRGGPRPSLPLSSTSLRNARASNRSSTSRSSSVTPATQRRAAGVGEKSSARARRRFPDTRPGAPRTSSPRAVREPSRRAPVRQRRLREPGREHRRSAVRARRVQRRRAVRVRRRRDPPPSLSPEARSSTPDHPLLRWNPTRRGSCGSCSHQSTPDRIASCQSLRAGASRWPPLSVGASASASATRVVKSTGNDVVRRDATEKAEKGAFARFRKPGAGAPPQVPDVDLPRAGSREDRLSVAAEAHAAHGRLRGRRRRAGRVQRARGAAAHRASQRNTRPLRPDAANETPPRSARSTRPANLRFRR